MDTTKKIKRTAFVLFVAVSVILLWNIYFTLSHPLAVGTPDGTLTAYAIVQIAGYVIGLLFQLIMLTLSLVLLFSVKKDETPFNLKNVKLLKSIAIALVAFEPFGLITQWASAALAPPLPIGEVAFFTQGGFVLTAGLIVYCISLVFEHGISLQNQIDETL